MPSVRGRLHILLSFPGRVVSVDKCGNIKGVRRMPKEKERAPRRCELGRSVDVLASCGYRTYRFHEV